MAAYTSDTIDLSRCIYIFRALNMAGEVSSVRVASTIDEDLTDFRTDGTYELMLALKH